MQQEIDAGSWKVKKETKEDTEEDTEEDMEVQQEEIQRIATDKVRNADTKNYWDEQMDNRI